jgi:putative inorganic carbon (HCO3(-)) transporter
MSVEAGGFDARLVGSGTTRSWRLPAESGAFLLTAVLFLALNFQMVSFKGRLADPHAVAGPALKAYHGLFVCFGVLLLVRGRMVRWRPEMVAYFLVVGITTLVAALRFGPQTVTVNTAFAAYAATIGATMGHLAGATTALRALRWVSVFMLLAVLAKAALFLPEILAFLASPFGHPTLPTFYGGGPNLEATWVTMGGVFLIGTRAFIPYMMGSAAISVAYASRVGLIIVAIVVMASVVGTMLRGRSAGGSRRWLLPVALCAITVAGVAAARGVTGADYIIRRFESIGEDPGSTGRLTLWNGGVRVFADHPFGVGIGNAIPLAERALAAGITEDNLHNQYLQHLVETGVQGLAVYLLLVGVTWRRMFASRLHDPMLLYVGIYFLLAALQFRGGEALAWFIFGLQSGCSSLSRTQEYA